jgi:RNA polymerase sigma-70 factor, ECF subfamily
VAPPVTRLPGGTPAPRGMNSRPTNRMDPAVFERERPRLLVMARRMLGCGAEAEEVVQETYLRWHFANQERIGSPEAWLGTACMRLSVDRLRAPYRRRERSLGDRASDVARAPGLYGGQGAAFEDPRESVEREESLSAAFQILLERLSPLERAAFLLREAFNYDYPELAAVLERSEPACRQLVSRARRALDRGPRFPEARGRAVELLASFLGAARQGVVGDLEAELASDIRSETGSRPGASGARAPGSATRTSEGFTVQAA